MSGGGEGRSELLAVVLAATASIAVGTVPFLVRYLQTTGYDTLSMLFLRYALGICVLIALALLRRERATGSGPATFLALVGLGAFASAQVYLYYTAIETVSTSVAVTLFFAYPLVSLLIDLFFFRIRVPASTVIAILAIVAGVVATSLPELAMAKADARGIIFAVLTPILYAVYVAGCYSHAGRLPPFLAAVMLYSGQILMFGLAVAVSGLVLPASAAQWAAVIAIATVGGALQIASFTYALPRLSGSGYAVVVSLELVTVVLIGVALLGERLTPAQLAGIALVLASVVYDRLMRARGG
jgi:drug/metabolite transporter (DMT)-like permease